MGIKALCYETAQQIRQFILLFHNRRNKMNLSKDEENRTGTRKRRNSDEYKVLPLTSYIGAL